MVRGLALALLALAAWPARAVEAQYTAAARLEVRARSNLRQGRVAALDVELSPAIEGALLGGRSRISLFYAPSLTLVGLEGLGNAQLPTTTAVLHRGRLSLSTAVRRAAFTLIEDVAYGQLDITALRTPDGALPGTLAEYTTLGVIPYLRSNTSLSVTGDPSPRWSYSASAGYQLSGDPSGLDSSYALQLALDGRPTANPRTTRLPFQYGPVGSASVRVRAAAAHVLVTTVTISQAHFEHLVQGPRNRLPTPIAENFLVQAIESWEGRLGHLVTATFGAGAAYSRERIAPWQEGSIAGDYRELLPVLQGAVTARLPVAANLLTLDGGLRLAPYANRFSGVTYERLEARALATWIPIRNVTATASLSGTVGVGVGANAQPGEKTLGTEVGAEWRLKPWLSVAGLARALYNEQRTAPLFAITPGFQWQASVWVAVRQSDSTVW